MTTMFPIPVWQQGMTQPSVPVNDAMLRQEVLARGATSIISAPPGSPIDGQVHIVGPAPTGAWAGFAQHNVVMWRSGTWHRFAPFTGWLKQVGTEVRRFSGTAWEIGAEPSGAAAAAVAAHVAAADPHPQYLTAAEAAAAHAPLSHTHDASAIVSGTIDPARLPVFPSTVQIVAATIAGLTAGEQAQIGDGSLVTTTDGRRWIYTGAGSKTDEASYIVLADVTPEWAAISGRPTTLAGYGITDAAAIVHGHVIADVTGLQSALDAKLDDSQATAAGLAVLGAATHAAQRTLLNVADGATANAPDAALRDRSTHTGSQAVTTTTFTATARFAGRTTAGAGATEELTAAQALAILGVAAGATANATDAALRDRATHTGTQPHTTITGLGTAATQPTTAFEVAGAVNSRISAGTANNQFSRWNHAANRWEGIAPATARSTLGVDTYVNSRGQNLITNGTGLFRDNTNFSGFVFNGTDAFFSTGSFVDSTFASARFSDEFIPVDPNLTYRLTVHAKANPATGGRNLVGIAMHDADGLQMNAGDVMFSSPATTLAVDLLPGATTITLASTTGWTGSVNSFGRGIIVWNYVNSLGFAYPPQTYSRNRFFNLWASDASVNTSTGVITLSVPWAGVAIPAGTPLSRSNSGSTFKYITTATDIPYTNQWVAHTGTIGGVDTTGTNIINMFPPGVASVRLVFLNNRDIAGSTAWYSNIQFGVDLQEAFDGTANNQLGRWNQTARRWEVLTPAMLPDALDDAAAAVAGVAVGTVYRTGTTIKMRIA